MNAAGKGKFPRFEIKKDPKMVRLGDFGTTTGVRPILTADGGGSKKKLTRANDHKDENRKQYENARADKTAKRRF